MKKLARITIIYPKIIVTLMLLKILFNYINLFTSCEEYKFYNNDTCFEGQLTTIPKKRPILNKINEFPHRKDL